MVSHGLRAYWLKMARREHGVVRVKARPTHSCRTFIALGDNDVFIAPQSKSEPVTGWWEPINSIWAYLGENELALTPEIRLDLVEDKALLAAAARGDTSAHIDDVKNPSQVFSVPARLLLAPDALPKRAFVLYQHILAQAHPIPMMDFSMWVLRPEVGKSGGRNIGGLWKLVAHCYSHRKLREEMSAGRVTYIHHKVMAVTEDIEKLYATEEWLVEGHWHDQRRLNMIPGGKSGLRYFRENNMLTERTAPSPDERDFLVEDWLREHPRRGLPAPWVSEKWKDNEWAIAQICGRDDRLSVEQVRAIRELAKNLLSRSNCRAYRRSK